MKLKLYQFISSPYCAKVRKILEFKGADFEVVELDFLERKELLLASGELTVPALSVDSTETIVDSDRIAVHLEQLYPEPTILPPAWRGLHIAMARYIDSALGDPLLRLAAPDELRHYGRQGPDRAAFWRLMREQRYGSGFCERMEREAESNWERARELLGPFEEALGERAFLFGRIGLADFALYGQLHCLAFTGELKIPEGFPNLRSFFRRVDRISAAPENDWG